MSFNKEDINYFKFVSNYESKKQVIEEITDFIEHNFKVNIVEETKLINELIKQVYNK